jgi:hypothetical protein
MKITMRFFLFLFLLTGIAVAQNGIGTTAPDPSSLLEISSVTKGLLPPRMSTEQRDLILKPANGLVIYNTTKKVLEHNSGSPILVKWTSISTISKHNSGFDSINAIGNVETASIENILAPDMILTPSEGTYFVSFESQYKNSKVEIITEAEVGGISTLEGVTDLQNIYEQLNSKIVTNTSHGAILGNGETLTEGVYSILSAVTLLETLTLDGQNNPDSVFVFKIGAAFNAAAGATIILKNGAKACNVFWVTEAAIVLGANSNMKGMLLSHGAAIGAGANCVIEGRLFSTAAAITSAADFIAITTDCSYVNLGILSSFVVFTSIGAITNTAISTITGNIGSNIGAITGFESVTLNGKIYSHDTPVIPLKTVTTTSYLDNNNNVLATFGIYKNGILIPSASKTLTSTANASNVSLQALVSVVSGETIEVRWKSGSDKITMGNRTMTALKME